VKVLKSGNDAVAAEAKRVLLNSPNWIPAKENGKAVSSEYMLPMGIQRKK